MGYEESGRRKTASLWRVQRCREQLAPPPWVRLGWEGKITFEFRDADGGQTNFSAMQGTSWSLFKQVAPLSSALYALVVFIEYTTLV
uniref:Uncharacterized protein n=1 Tax=Pristionchus pacificus TaxID=54126 RepID=A0A2A6CBQ2_PRIPA|eukprot:PDM75451.1 hypothetical protein PRIPAC_42628 [Pristionchus pacificus]